MSQQSVRERVRRFRGFQQRGAGFGARLTALAVLGWILVDGDAVAWAWGLPVMVLAALAHPWLPPGEPWRWNPIALLRLLPLFLWFSLRSGVEIAWIALHPRRPLAPALLDYRWRLPPGPARLFLASLINLVPGTLSLRIRERAVTIHVLSHPGRAQRFVMVMEARVAALFQVPLREEGA